MYSERPSSARVHLLQVVFVLVGGLEELWAPLDLAAVLREEQSVHTVTRLQVVPARNALN